MIKFYSIFLFLVFTQCKVFASLSFTSEEIRDKLYERIDEYRFSFEFYNDSDVPVKIINIISSCDCVKIESDKKTYQPNEEGKINGVFDIGDRTGYQKKEFIVITDENNSSKYKLTLSLDITAPSMILPRLLTWKYGDDSTKEFYVKISNKFKISKIEYDNNFFLVKILIKEQNKVKVKPIGSPTKGKYTVKFYFIDSNNDAEFSTDVYLIFN